MPWNKFMASVLYFNPPATADYILSCIWSINHLTHMHHLICNPNMFSFILSKLLPLFDLLVTWSPPAAIRCGRTPHPAPHLLRLLIPSGPGMWHTIPISTTGTRKCLREAPERSLRMEPACHWGCIPALETEARQKRTVAFLDRLEQV